MTMGVIRNLIEKVRDYNDRQEELSAPHPTEQVRYKAASSWKPNGQKVWKTTTLPDGKVVGMYAWREEATELYDESAEDRAERQRKHFALDEKKPPRGGKE